MKEHYFSRDISWVDFNIRVMSEAESPVVLPLDKLKFLAIVSSNLDEFFMVRMATQWRAMEQGNHLSCPSGLKPNEQLEILNKKIRGLVTEQYTLLDQQILPQLVSHGIQKKGFKELSPSQLKHVTKHFNEAVFPVLTPVKAEENKPFPFAGNLKINIMYLLEELKTAEQKLVILQLPQPKERLIILPAENGRLEYILLEDVLENLGSKFFQGYKILETLEYRVTRDADMGVDEDREDDFLEAMEEILEYRKRSRPVRLEIKGTSLILEEKLRKAYNLDESMVYNIQGPLDLKSFMPLVFSAQYDDLREKDWKPRTPIDFDQGRSIFDVISEADRLLHHPYDSFAPIINFVQEASDDPDVMAIKMTLYRTSGNSPVIQFLERAAQKGKQVTVMVELKARFDEQQNLEWASRLERAGVIVVYGVQRLKVHAKALLIIRRESEGIKRYCHLSTGNYNDSTAKLYTDFGFLTADEKICYEASLFFNAITGYSSVPHLQKIVMAPQHLRDKLIMLIKRESKRAEQGQSAFIHAKLNSLADPEIIKHLYQASESGVEIKLNVRGICTLVPGVKGMSSNIQVVSIIDRFLEHSRLVHFHDGGNDELYLSSADWMPRNLSRRVELLFPIEKRELKNQIIECLAYAFQDNTKAHQLRSDGSYVKKSGKPEFRMQRQLYLDTRLRTKKQDEVRDFVVRRK